MSMMNGRLTKGSSSDCSKSLSSKELARELMSVLSVQYSIGTQQLLVAMKDCASVNEVVVRTLNIIYPSASHTLLIV